MENLIIANPVSGRRRSLEKAEAVRRLLERAGSPTELTVTREAGHARRLAAEALAAGARRVIGCGGDGTLQEIAGALAGTAATLGIIPVGRCNDLARALGFSARDEPADLAKALLSATSRAIDLGLMEPAAAAPRRLADTPVAERRVFCTVATLGFDSEVNRFVAQHRLPFKGTLAYLYGILRVLVRFACPRVRLRGDFGEYQGRILLAATANSPCYGGAMQIAPGALLDDGLLHVCIVQAVPRRTVLRILPGVFKGRHISHPAVKLVTTRRLEIDTPDGPQWICADGESLGQTPATLSNLARVLHVSTPAARSPA